MAIMALFAGPVNNAGAESAAAGAHRTILAFGDSLTAGYGILLKEAFPAQLEKRLKTEGFDVTVVNGGVSGDTTSGGLARLDWALAAKPDSVILELGANDMLRGVDPSLTRENLRKILEELKKRKIPVLLAGMKAAPNMGPVFAGDYIKMYRSLADEYDAVYYPFFLEGAFLQPGLMLEDGLHPNAAGVGIMVENILPAVKKLLALSAE